MPPSTILHLDNTVAELRRIPAPVEHHHRHHAVVLTKISLNTRLDRSSRDVIDLNVCRTPIQPSVEEEFRQHDGVVTMMMFHRRRASPKLRNGIIEV